MGAINVAATVRVRKTALLMSGQDGNALACRAEKLGYKNYSPIVGEPLVTTADANEKRRALAMRTRRFFTSEADRGRSASYFVAS
jgi:hypothetical protein